MTMLSWVSRSRLQNDAVSVKVQADAEAAQDAAKAQAVASASSNDETAAIVLFTPKRQR